MNEENTAVTQPLIDKLAPKIAESKAKGVAKLMLTVGMLLGGGLATLLIEVGSPPGKAIASIVLLAAGITLWEVTKHGN